MSALPAVTAGASLLWQAAAEYMGVMISRGLVSADQALNALAAQLEEHWLAVAIGALVVLALWRVLAPRR